MGGAQKNGAKLPYEPVHGSLRGSDGGQAPKRLPTAVGAVFGNGISSRVRQEVICELQEFGRRRRNGMQNKNYTQGVHLLIRRSSVRGSVLRCKEEFKLHHTKVFQGPSPKYMEVPL